MRRDCAIDIENAVRYNQLVGKMVPGEHVQEIVETLINYHKEIAEEVREELQDLIDSTNEELEKYHDEISDRHVDIVENIRKDLNTLRGRELSRGIMDYLDDISYELDRIETDLSFEVT